MNIFNEEFFIEDSFGKCKSVLQDYQNITVSISGGADSDVVLDLIEKNKGIKKIRYIWIDTGLEYQATKNHLLFLENKYNVEIEKIRATTPIPISNKKYGEPFISKYVSEMISRLQRHDFNFQNPSKTFEIAYEKYPNCKIALKWFYNDNENDGKRISSFNIGRNKYLREFLIFNGLNFKISNKCCDGAKKKPITKFHKKQRIDLSITGIRKAEGGARATAYKGCLDSKENEVSKYRPIFLYNDAIKKTYENKYNVEHSKCYTEYGLKRTGCAGCPFGRDFEYELEVIKKYEPKLYKAVNNIFGESYSLTRKYLKYKNKNKEK